MGKALFLLLTAAVLCVGECVQVGPQQFGRIEVSAFSIVGERLPNLQVDLVEIGTQKSFKGQFHGGVAKQIPYGNYIVHVFAPGFRTATREFILDQPETLLRMQLSLSVECGGYEQLRGATHPAPGDRELWVKLVPLRGVGGAETLVQRDGSFYVAGLEDGQYLVIVADGEEILYTTNVRLPAGPRLDLILKRD